MISATTNTSPTPLEQTAVEQTSFVHDESGQISILVVLCVIPFIFLVAFIFNSANQTSRKIEMQGAADGAAVAGAVTMARGMNLMVLNNNSMADVLSIMVIVRAITNTARFFFYFRTATTIIVCAAVITWLGPCEHEAALAAKWYDAFQFWDRIDDALNNEDSGLGWTILDLLDKFNQLIKISFPVWAMYQAREYAHKNGANWGEPYGFILPGASDPNLKVIGLQLPIPTFPVARGPEQAIAERAWTCHFTVLRNLSGIALLALWAPPEDLIFAAGLYEALVISNFGILKGGFGGWVGDVLRYIGGSVAGKALRMVVGWLGDLLGIKMLEWSSEPPKPMLLTDTPKYDRDSETDQQEVDEDARNRLRPYLQYLGFALGDVPRGSPIGGERFLNKPNSLPGAFGQMQFTFAQADVYNPLQWDMWTQDWRAQLTRSKLFDEKVNSLFQIFNLGGGAPSLDWSLVNTH